jgi:hypothetical protein
MIIKKKASTYDTYTLEISYLQLVSLERLLSDSASEPVVDELLGALQFYLDELPKPGEDKSEKEKDEDAAKGEGSAEDAEAADAGASAAEDEMLEAPPEPDGGGGGFGGGLGDPEPEEELGQEGPTGPPGDPGEEGILDQPPEGAPPEGGEPEPKPEPIDGEDEVADEVLSAPPEEK